MTAAARSRVVVVGGGIAGLSAARALASRHEVVLVERETRLGGKIATATWRGRPLDLGPDNFITRNGAALQLCQDLGLEDELLPPATSSAAVFARGRPRLLPAGLVLGVPTDLSALRRSGIVGPAAVARAAADLVLPTRRTRHGLDDDLSIADVVTPRLGRAVLEALVDPLLGGIHAGDSGLLSFRATAPQLAAAAKGRRSLISALRPSSAGAAVPPDASTRAHPLFLGLRGGMGDLVARLALECSREGVEIRTDSGARRLERSSTGGDGGTGDGAGPGAVRPPTWRVEVGDDVLDADGIVLALPANDAARLLAAGAPELAQACGEVPYSGVVTVTLAWPEAAVPQRLASLLVPEGPARAPGGGTAACLPGSGVLVPRVSGLLVTAATFTSTKWPRSANSGEAVVRVSAGRHGDGRALALDDDELVAAVRADLATVLGITDAPLDTYVQRWPGSFPQYVTGYSRLAERIASLAATLPGLALAGAAYGGIGIPACIASGQQAAADVGAQLGR